MERSSEKENLYCYFITVKGRCQAERTEINMCDICQHSPCLSRCPNAPEPEKVYQCEHCGEDIIEGEEYIEIYDNYYHLDCFVHNSVEIVEKECGASTGVAEVEHHGIYL